MRIGSWVGLTAAAALLAGCGNFWQAPSTSSTTGFSLTNGGNIAVVLGSSNTDLITVTPGSSFTGTVTLTCAVTNGPSTATSATDPTCTFTSSSLTFSSATAQSPTLTAAASSTTPVGAYQITVTGVSGSVAASTTFCVAVGTTTSSCSSTATTSGNFYILNGGTTPQIVGESIVSGTLTSISGGTVTLPGAGTIPFSIAVAPNGKFLCVSTNNGVFAYTISSGVLGTAVQVTQDQPYAVQIDSTDKWLVEAIPILGGGQVTFEAVPIDPSTGANNGSAVLPVTFTITNASLQKNQMVISQDNANVFVALGTGGTLVVPFDSTNPFPSTVINNGIIIHVANSGSSGSALSVAVDPGTSPRLFYIGETYAGSSGTTGGLRAFTYASLSTPTALLQASGSPIASGGLAPNFILPAASGSYVYVANGTGVLTGDAGVIAGFSITGSSSSYTVAAAGTATAGIQPLGLAEDSSSSYLFEVGSDGSPYLDAYSIDASSGVLTSQKTSTTSANSIAIVAAP